MKTSLTKRLSAAALALLMAVSVTACSKEDDSKNENESVFTPDSSAADESKDVSDSDSEKDSKEDSEEESSDNSGAEDVKYLETDFFKFRVRDAYLSYEVAGYVPNDPTFTHLAVDIEAVSTSLKEIPMGTYDYIIKWGDGEDEWDYALDSEFTDNQYPLDTYINFGEKIEGYVFFIVPPNEDEYTLEYLTIYDDDTTGETYSIKIQNPVIKMTREDYEAANPDAQKYDDEGYSLADSFKFKVTDAFLAEEISGYSFDDGSVFLGAELEIINTSDSDIEFSVYDLMADYGENYEEYNYAVYEDFTDGQFPIDVTIKPGEAQTGYVYFIVSEGIPDFYIDYITFNENDEIEDYYYTYFMLDTQE